MSNQEKPSQQPPTLLVLPGADKKANEEVPSAFVTRFRKTLGPVASLIEYILKILDTLIRTIGNLLLLLIRTPGTLLPSVATTTAGDESYNDAMLTDLGNAVEKLDLEEADRETIKKRWIDQIAWTERRATRERDANELIRWWQIILGVLIPALISADSPLIGDFRTTDLAGIAGVFVAVVTAIAQFRRPEDRWRHYRVITERYQDEFWSFITLSPELYKAPPSEGKASERVTHKRSLQLFHSRMSTIKREEVAKFFNEVVPSNMPTQGNLQNNQNTSPAGSSTD
jgi:hypothetical protein